MKFTTLYEVLSQTCCSILVSPDLQVTPKAPWRWGPFPTFPWVALAQYWTLNAESLRQNLKLRKDSTTYTALLLVSLSQIHFLYSMLILISWSTFPSIPPSLNPYTGNWCGYPWQHGGEGTVTTKSLVLSCLTLISLQRIGYRPP